MIDASRAGSKGDDSVAGSGHRGAPDGMLASVQQAQELGKTTMKTLIGILAVVVIAAAPTVASAAAPAKKTAHAHHHHHHAKKVAKVQDANPMGHLLHDMFK